MNRRIAVLPGDGIGEEVMTEALRVLDHIEAQYGHRTQRTWAAIGGAAYDSFGMHFPEDTRNICAQSDAILFGSVGGPISEQHLEKWKGCETNALLGLRKAFNFHANFRPVRVYPEIAEICPLRPEIVGDGVDILFLRELVGDIYFGEHKTFLEAGRRKASDVAEYTEDQIAAIARVAFQAARGRRKKVTSVDKANVLDTSKLWRAVVSEISQEFPDVECHNMLVDNCAMQLILKPSQFDVILTSNMFGDILSDAGAVLPGSLGLMASASMNADGFGMFEPPGGSAQDIAGTGVANPIGQILSVAMLLRFSFGLDAEAKAIEQGVSLALQNQYRTKDIYRGTGKLVGTKQMTDAILASISPH